MPDVICISVRMSRIEIDIAAFHPLIQILDVLKSYCHTFSH